MLIYTDKSICVNMNYESKDFIIYFNKNKTKHLYKEVLSLYFPNKANCRICSDVIYYYDSKIGFSKTNGMFLGGKSYETKKVLYDTTYYLSCCEDCLSKKYPKYKITNKSKVFNHMNDMTMYAFDIPTEIAKRWKSDSYAITESNLIKKHGETKGKEMWKNYCDKQSYSNTYEYKRDKYGWDRDKFDDYNKSRSVTLENLINRHGEEVGIDMWNEYCDKQRYTTTIEYFIGKYGEEIGTSKFNDFCIGRLNSNFYSDMSQTIFNSLYERLKTEYKEIYYATLNQEYFQYDNNNKKYYLIDFYIKDINVGIEFNGDVWHANPNKYNGDDIPIQKFGISSNEIWERDKKKNDFLNTRLNKLLIYWEEEYNKIGLESLVDKIIKDIKTN